MAAGVAHEINNPLTAILGFAQLVMANKNVDPDIKRDMEIIERESKRCVGIIENLLSFARPRGLDKARININSTVEATLQIVKYSLERDKVDIKLDLSQELPVVMGDSQQLQQVFLNLVLNAANAMPSGGILEISTFERSRSENGLSYVCVAFKDSGIGISADVKEKIFEPFFTTSYKTGKKGTGLGLPICYSIVNEHGGVIEVESEPEKGSTFTVVLPAVET